MTRLHEAASAVKHKVQDTISQCFSSKQWLTGDENLVGSRESDASSLGPSVSSVTEYFDAEADGYATSSDLSDFDGDSDSPDEFREHHENVDVQSDAEVLDATRLQKKQQQKQQNKRQHHHPHLHHQEDNPGGSALADLVPVNLGKVEAMQATLAENASLDQTKMDSLTLMRFLIARNMDVQKAAEMFSQHYKWRQEFVSKGYISASECAHQLAAEKTLIQGLDRIGRPLMIVQGCKHVAKDRDMEEFKRYTVYCMDKTIASMPEGVSQFCCIFDLDNTGLKNFDTAALYVTLDFFQAHYPERLAKIFVIHVPYVFWGVWKVASKAVQPRTRAKITFLTDEEASGKLMREFGEECVPKIYGGSAEIQLAQDFQMDSSVRIFC